MDTIKLSCRCGQHIEVNRTAVGQRFNCPACDILLAVPAVLNLPGTMADHETLSAFELTRKKFKQAIIVSVLIFIGGVTLGVIGVGINRKPLWMFGIIVAVIGFGGLLKVKSQIRRNQIQDKERMEFYRKHAKRN